MRDYLFEFSNAQDVETLDSTGIVSAYVWDLENSASGVSMRQTDFMVHGWVNFIILASTNTTGNNFRITLVSSSTEALTGTLKYLGGTELLIPEIITGYRGCFGVHRHTNEQFLGVWYKAATTTTGATTVDCWFSPWPEQSPNDSSQKRSNTAFG